MVQTVSGGEVAKAGGSVLGLASLPLLPGHQPCEVLSPTEPVAVAPQPAVARISPHEGTGLQGFNIFFPISKERRSLPDDRERMRHNIRKLFNCLMGRRVNCGREIKGNQ